MTDVDSSGAVPDSRFRAWRDGSAWFDEHREAAQQVVDFLAADGIRLKDNDVADVGCGDGILDLNLADIAEPRTLTGFDLLEVDEVRLFEIADRAGIEVPTSLRFRKCVSNALPAPDDAFDAVVSWSTFEHVLEPVSVLRDIKRVLRSNGILMIQLFPFFFSEHGSHLPEWAPEGFLQLQEGGMGRVEPAVRNDLAHDPAWADMRLTEARTLNRITLDDLHRALLAAGFWVSKVEPIAGGVHLPREAARYRLSDLVVGGVLLLANRA